MTRPLRFLLACLLALLFLAALERAADYEQARAGSTVTSSGLRKTFGHGLIKVNGHGPEWHRWQRVKDKRRLEAVVARKNETIRRLKAELEQDTDVSPTLAIRLVFGAYAEQALRVAWCESRYYTGAQNGQYLGLFQMGSYARARYGHSWSALGQARAAYAYFVDSGRDWSPWECKP